MQRGHSRAPSPSRASLALILNHRDFDVRNASPIAEAHFAQEAAERDSQRAGMQKRAAGNIAAKTIGSPRSRAVELSAIAQPGQEGVPPIYTAGSVHACEYMVPSGHNISQRLDAREPSQSTTELWALESHTPDDLSGCMLSKHAHVQVALKIQPELQIQFHDNRPLPAVPLSPTSANRRGVSQKTRRLSNIGGLAEDRAPSSPRSAVPSKGGQKPGFWETVMSPGDILGTDTGTSFSHIPEYQKTEGGAGATTSGASGSVTVAQTLATDEGLQHSRKRPKLDCPYKGCRGKFGQRSNLNKHIRVVHERLRPHKCDQCGKRFSQRSVALNHIKAVHEGIKPFACEICNQLFSDKSNRKKHVKLVHNKERAHQCTLCEKKFGEKRSLSDHISSVHLNQKPHVCDFCGSHFAQKSHLVIHKRTKHFSGEEKQSPPSL